MESLGKVLIIVENLPVPFDRRVWMEATALRKNGYEVSVICPMDATFSEPYEELEGIHIYRHPLPPDTSSVTGYLKEYFAALSWEFRLAQRVWRERGFDIVHICNPPDLLFTVAAWFKMFKGVSVIFDHHDLNPELYIAKYDRRDIFYHGLRIAERLTFATADTVISTNHSYREVALTRGRKNLDDVFVVRSGPDLSRFCSVPRNDAYLNGRKYLVGYVGVMGEQEGIEYLLEAVRYLVYDCDRHDIQFVLIGRGPVIDQLKQMAIDLGIDEYVEFTGRVSNEELLERLSTCDVCVNPDRKNDLNDKSTMNKIMEYMALGKPIVQFDLLEGKRSAAGASLYAEPNNSIDFAEKIVELLRSPELRAEMAAEGRSRMIQQLEWRHQIPKLLAAYRHVLQKRSVCAQSKRSIKVAD
ncbi:MAG: glycosyltransferase family 4 protein [Leptolyngbyaceae bacterium]|nr:glycosyltransferase family 4 protein [Leptolyngbyaceae bacterium]